MDVEFGGQDFGPLWTYALEVDYVVSESHEETEWVSFSRSRVLLIFTCSD